MGAATCYELLGHVSLAQIHLTNISGDAVPEYAAQIVKGMQELYTIGAALNEYDSKKTKDA